MRSKVVNWIKANRLTFILLLIVGYFAYQRYLIPLYYDLSYKFAPQVYDEGYGGGGPDYGYTESAPAPMKISRGGMPMPISPPYYQAPPTTDIKERMVIRNSNLSLFVNDVGEVQKQIIRTTESLGGYMVNSNLNNSEYTPASSYITVRIPSDKLKEALQQFRTFAVKVINENLSGEDVSDLFVDNEAKLETLEKTKAIFEGMLDKATKVEEILNVQQQILNVQSQIDSIKGQQKYLEQNSKLALVTINLSTDELALPYSPVETWRPAVIFKQATRSLIGNLRKIGSAIIWLAVYSLFWLPALLLILYLKKRFKK